MRPFHLLPILSLFLLCSHTLSAQETTINPPLLYPGENVLTIRSTGGIRSVAIRMIDSNSLRQIEFRKIGRVEGCVTAYDIEATVRTASEIVGGEILVERCDGTVDRIMVQSNTAWALDQIVFPETMVGQNVCSEFRISQSSPSGRILLDSVTVDHPDVTIHHTRPMPVQVESGTVYHYSVCFRGVKPGIYRFPIVTWIRREYPNGGYTTYPVADTGLVRVVDADGTAQPDLIQNDFSTATSRSYSDPLMSRQAREKEEEVK